MNKRLSWAWCGALLAAACGPAGCRQSTSPSGESSPAAATAPGEASAGADRPLQLVMVPKATQMSFWAAVRQGAEEAAAKLGVNVVWKGPAVDNDRAAQMQVVQQFLDESVDGLLLAPTDSRVLAPAARTAMEKGIPVLIFDSALEGEVGKDFVSLVATDNQAAGKLGGAALMKLVGPGGKVILFRHMEGHDSTGNRETGALAEFEAAQADVLEKDRYSGESASVAQQTALNMIDKIREAAGIFASNQTSSEGLLLALQQNNLAGKIKFVGFDSSPMLVSALRQGEVDALVVQDPRKMGYTAVEKLTAHLRGEKIEPQVDMPAVLVTRENIDDPDVAKLFQE